MRFASLIAFAAVGAPLLAQSQPGQDPGKSTKDENIEYTSRSSIPGTIAGRLSTHLGTGYYAGTTSLRVFNFISQDQDAATQESFTFEVRAQDPTTGFPDWPSNPATPIYSQVITNPAGSGIAAWIWTVTPATPLAVSGGDPLYLDWLVPSNALWVADGVSMQMGSGSPHACGVSGAPACCGPAALPTLGGWERTRGHQPTGTQPNIQNLAPADTLAGPLAYANLDRQYFHWVGFGPNVTGNPTNQPALQGIANDSSLGGPSWFCAVNNPNTGAAAMRPDVNDALSGGRNDDLGWRVRGGLSYAGGLALVFNTLSAMDSAIPTPFGQLWLNPFESLFSSFIQGPIVLDSGGVGTMVFPLGLPVSSARSIVAGLGNLHSQALVLNSTLAQISFTNLHTFQFDLAGGTTFAIDAANPATGASSFPNTLTVSNDGPGHVSVQFLDGANNVLASALVRERTGRAIITVPGTVNYRIVTANTNAGGTNQTKGQVR